MILHRAVFQAKFGKANDLVAAFKQSTGIMTAEQVEALQPRILTDLSGPFDTVVLETTHESLAAFEQFTKALWAVMDADEEPSPTEGLIESGRNEHYTIET
jgi:hypothetical protein